MTAGLGQTIPLLVYRGATVLLELGAGFFLRARMRRGKEDPARLSERLGKASRTRPSGPLVWVHGASVGEGLALLPLIEGFVARGFPVLVTTGTVTSARVLAARLPTGAFHQFMPLDGPRAARRFVRQWRPIVACFVESDLWPNLLSETKRHGIPTALVNARMSDRSFARWRMLPALIGPLLRSFDLILAQTEADAARLAHLSGQHVLCAGNLKFDVAPPPAHPAALDALLNATAGRTVWVAASTHAGEDETCCGVHRDLKAEIPGLLTVIVPRKTDRGPALLAYAASLGLSAAARSGAQSITPGTDLYIADTMGELGLFYRLHTAVFVGKSLVAGGGGQNPIEAAKLGNAILHGPHTSNFTEVYATLDLLGGGVLVDDPTALTQAVGMLLVDRTRLDAIAERATQAVAGCEGATTRALAALEPYLAASRTGLLR